MLTWWCRNSLKAATAYTWAVTYTLVLSSVGVPKQSFTSVSSFFVSLHEQSSLCISRTWILILGHQSAPGKLTNAQRSPTPIYRLVTTQTTASKRALAPRSHTPGPLHHFLVRQPISRWHQASPHAAEVQFVAVCPVSLHPTRMVWHALEVHV